MFFREEIQSFDSQWDSIEIQPGCANVSNLEIIEAIIAITLRTVSEEYVIH